MQYAEAIRHFMNTHALEAMLAMSAASALVMFVAKKLYARRYARARGDPAAKAVLRHIKYYAQKTEPVILSITAPGKEAYKAFRIGDVTKFTPQHLLQDAAEKAWRNEACRAWLEACRPEFEIKYRSMQHPERKVCKNYMRRTLHEMPRGVLVQVNYRKPNGKRSKPGSLRISTMEMTEWLQDSAPGIEPVELLRAMRKHDFRCTRCGAGIDETRTMVAYRNEDNKCEPRCPRCVFEED